MRDRSAVAKRNAAVSRAREHPSLQASEKIVPIRDATRQEGPGAYDLCYGRAPMPINVQAHITGTIWKIEVQPGDPVEEGQTLVIIESMKMEMPVEAPSAGMVESISVAEGQAVEEGAILLTLA